MTLAEDYERVGSLELVLGETKGIERARTLYELAGAYFRTKQYLESVGTFEQAAELFEELRERAEASEARRMAAWVMAEIGWVDEAIPLLEQVIEDFGREGDEVGVARSKSLLADIFLYQAERPEDALESARQARQSFLAADVEDRAGYCSLQIGHALDHLGDVPEALVEWEKAEVALGRSGIHEYQAEALLALAEAHFEGRNYEESIWWHKKAKVAYEAAGYANGMFCDSQIEEAKKRLISSANQAV